MRIFLIILTIISVLSAEDKLIVKLSKHKAYLNEPIVAKITAIYEKKARYITLKKIKNSNFYAKFIKENNATKVNGHYSKSYYYALFPQAVGNLTLKPLKVKISTREEKTGFLISKEIKSKPIKIEVYATPNSLAISGNLSMKLLKNSSDIKPNRPANFKLIIKGSANLDDIKAFKAKVMGATYFSDKPKREYRIVKGKLQALFIQNFTIVSSQSYKIMPFKLKYFNTQTQMEESLSTKEINVKIETPLLTPKEYITLFIGIILGVFLSIFALFLKRPKKPNSDIEIAIKKAKNDKELYKLLLPYSNVPKYRELIAKLEKRIYKNSQ